MTKKMSTLSNSEWRLVANIEFNPFSEGTVLIRQNLMSVDVTFVPSLEIIKIFGRRSIA